MMPEYYSYAKYLVVILYMLCKYCVINSSYEISSFIIGVETLCYFKHGWKVCTTITYYLGQCACLYHWGSIPTTYIYSCLFIFLSACMYIFLTCEKNASNLTKYFRLSQHGALLSRSVVTV